MRTDHRALFMSLKKISRTLEHAVIQLCKTKTKFLQFCFVSPVLAPCLLQKFVSHWTEEHAAAQTKIQRRELMSREVLLQTKRTDGRLTRLVPHTAESKSDIRPGSQGNVVSSTVEKPLSTGDSPRLARDEANAKSTWKTTSVSVQ